MSSSEPPTTGRAQRPDRHSRHLMQPGGPRPAVNPYTEDRGMTRVQQWVMSTLIVTTLLHLSAGIIIAAIFLPRPTTGAQAGLVVIAGAFGAIGAAAALLVHQRSPVSWWTAVGFAVPTAVGLAIVLG